MENYRKKLKLQNWLYAVGALLLIAVQILSYGGFISPVDGGARFGSFWNGFMAGAAFGVAALFIFGMIINLRALRNDQALRKLYLKGNDERSAAIHQMGKSTGATIFILGMLPVIIISGYFSLTVFFTCLACELALCLIIAAAKLYYCKKL